MGIENMSSQTKYSLSRVEIWPTDITNTVAAKEDAMDNVFFYRRVKPHLD
jgi:hypothetical protein